jgi:transglutaminase-like putative cysteine protease
MPHYAIRHITRFTYASPVSESLMEVRMQPRSEGVQRCLRFELGIAPRGRVLGYRDYLGNSIHHFDVPARHATLTVTARAHVQIDQLPPLPAALPDSAWDAVDRWAETGEHFDFRHPSRFAAWTDSMLEYLRGLGASGERAHDPLTTVRQVMAAIFTDFEYVPKSTRVDSPIDEALLARKGVCQDFAHIMIAMVRHLGLPARYVSGYIARHTATEREGLVASATHAWAEVLFPELGWVGFDPTNNTEASTRHIRVAVGRDYADVPPTRGVFKGNATSQLSVSVDVKPAEAPAALEPMLPDPQWATEDLSPPPDTELDKHLQAQQQQQQQ